MTQKLGDNLIKKRLKQKKIRKANEGEEANYVGADGTLYSKITND